MVASRIVTEFLPTERETEPLVESKSGGHRSTRRDVNRREIDSLKRGEGEALQGNRVASCPIANGVDDVKRRLVQTRLANQKRPVLSL